MSMLLAKFLGEDIGYLWLLIFCVFAVVVALYIGVKMLLRKDKPKIVSFILDGNKIEEIAVKKGKKLVLTDIVKDYEWYIDEGLKTKFSSIEVEENDITLYAKTPEVKVEEEKLVKKSTKKTNKQSGKKSVKKLSKKEETQIVEDKPVEEIKEEKIEEDKKTTKKTSTKSAGTKKNTVKKEKKEKVEKNQEAVVVSEEKVEETLDEMSNEKTSDKEEFKSVILSNDDDNEEDGIVVRVGTSVNKYLEKLHNLTPQQKKYYCQIKNEILACPELLNTITKDGDTFKLGNKTKFKINIVKKELKLFIDMGKDMLDKRYKGIENSELKKNKSVPLEITIKEDLDLRKAMSSIKRLIKNLDVYRKVNYKNKSFKTLTKII